LFDMKARALRRDRAARSGTEMFLYDRVFEDCLERVALVQRRFNRALLIGCPDTSWTDRLRAIAGEVEVLDPGALFASRADGGVVTEDHWAPPSRTFDLVLAIGTLDSVNDLPLALQLVRHAMQGDGLFLGAMPGGETLPKIRAAMRAADSATGAASPHVHPRLEPAAVAHLLGDAGFERAVVDVDRVPVAYRSLERLVADLRRMGVTNVLLSRPRFIGRAARAAALRAFAAAGDGQRTVETFEIVHFAAWTTKEP
jgi:NADH dehydrogenase [ubiquinone] 1 alpha subcomplex assembly factor 5